MQWNH